MVHERDNEYEGQEDGEYHFSDDQANYEMEPDITTKEETPKTAKASSLAEVSPKKMKRPVIGAAIFVVVIFLVYKIISPSSNTPTTDFAQTSSSVPTKVITTHQPVEKTTVVTTTTTIPTKTVAPTTTTTVAAAPLPAMSAQQQQQSAPVVQQAMTQQPVPATAAAPVTTPELSSSQASAAIDKLIQLQDQNTKLVTQFQTESAQKIAEYEAQNNEMQGKLQDMALRMNALETTISHLTKALQDTRSGAASVAGNTVTAVPSAPMNTSGDGTLAVVMARPQSQTQAHSAYSVQAIIPGRAWLKSDSGDTVTVAEGDILKSYGKIIKIDPYDGVVQIDTNGKTVTLSYGVTTE